MKKVKVGINGYGVIGKRIAEAISLQDDMILTGISDISSDYRILMAQKKFQIYASLEEAYPKMKKARIEVKGILDDLIKKVDIVIDCTPKMYGAQNATKYTDSGIRFILQGGEKHEVTGHSFSAVSNYESAIGRMSTRVVSSNTTSIVRSLSALKKASLLKRARGVLLRGAADPRKNQLNEILNSFAPVNEISSHHGYDAQSVDPEFDVLTSVVRVSENFSCLHFWNITLTHLAVIKDVIEAFRKMPRLSFILYGSGLSDNNVLKDVMLDIERPYGDMYEVALWEDMIKIEEDELFYTYLVDNQATVIPENIDAIRALTDLERNSSRSIEKTNKSLNLLKKFY